jgi:hypothetical protein
MRLKISELRRVIRRALIEGPAGPAVAADPTDVKGFYPSDVERGTDIHSFWYKSPGRPMGQDGDPFRPEDAAEYIGQKLPSEDEDNTPETGEELAAEEPSAEETEELEAV